jgi:hypothetical protein
MAKVSFRATKIEYKRAARSMGWKGRYTPKKQRDYQAKAEPDTAQYLS